MLLNATSKIVDEPMDRQVASYSRGNNKLTNVSDRDMMM